MKLNVLQADMRNFRLPEPVDCVASEWGPINHLRRKADLLKVTRSAARALRPGGYFYFDLHQRRLFEGWAESLVFESKRFLARKAGWLFTRIGPVGRNLRSLSPVLARNWTRHTDLFLHVHWSHRKSCGRFAKLDLTLYGFSISTILKPHPAPAPGKRSLRTMYLARKRYARRRSRQKQ